MQHHVLLDDLTFKQFRSRAGSLIDATAGNLLNERVGLWMLKKSVLFLDFGD